MNSALQHVTTDFRSMIDEERFYFFMTETPNIQKPVHRFVERKMKFSIKDFLVIFTEEILNGKLHFLCSLPFFCRVRYLQITTIQIPSVSKTWIIFYVKFVFALVICPFPQRFWKYIFDLRSFVAKFHPIFLFWGECQTLRPTGNQGSSFYLIFEQKQSFDA